MLKKNYSLIENQILVSLRGDLSQEQVNRRLGAHSNQVARWEAGRSQMDWHSFTEFCKAVKAPLSAMMKRHLFYEGDLLDQKAIVNFLSGFSSQKKVALILGLNPSRMSRIYSGKTMLELKMFFKLVDLSSYSLTEFLADLTFPRTPPLIQKEQERIRNEKKMHFDKPWIAALILYLRTKEYISLKQHSDKFLANKLGQMESEIKSVLNTLEEMKVIKMQDAKYVSQINHLSTGGSFDGARNIRKYWLEKFLEWMKKSKPGSTHYYGYKVFNIHKSSKKKLEDFFFRMHAELDVLVKEQPQTLSDDVFVFAAQMRNVDETFG